MNTFLHIKKASFIWVLAFFFFLGVPQMAQANTTLLHEFSGDPGDEHILPSSKMTLRSMESRTKAVTPMLALLRVH
jgi:hypothetical protein